MSVGKLVERLVQAAVAAVGLACCLLVVIQIAAATSTQRIFAISGVVGWVIWYLLLSRFAAVSEEGPRVSRGWFKSQIREWREWSGDFESRAALAWMIHVGTALVLGGIAGSLRWIFPAVPWREWRVALLLYEGLYAAIFSLGAVVTLGIITRLVVGLREGRRQ